MKKKKKWVLKKEIAKALDRVKNLLISLIIYPQPFSCYQRSDSWKMNLGVTFCQSIKEMLVWTQHNPDTCRIPLDPAKLSLYTHTLGTLYVWKLPVFKRKINLHKSTKQLDTARGKINFNEFKSSLICKTSGLLQSCIKCCQNKATHHKGQKPFCIYWGNASAISAWEMAETVDVLLCRKISLKTGSHIGEWQNSHTAKHFLLEFQVVV